MKGSKQRAKSIYLALVERVQAEHWSSYLDVACNEDPELREELESLLAANVPDQFLAQPAAAVIAMACPPMPLAKQGDEIGPYRLREQIGEGGMGVVYVAEQTQPVRRKVALKIVRPGLATQDVLARFEVERQALAMMDHPNIARIFDGGQTDAGDPFFVMELVQGPPITEYCDQHRLTTRQRLELFRHVCHAVQHAHQKGIIHRDLKPSNILVPRVDGIPVPKVIDFGVAKVVDLGMKMSEQTVYTQFTQMVGTPLYMSPEQTEPGVVDIDTRSDVYSLGVLLYELLTGLPPFESEMLKQAGFDEMRRIIREDDPPNPSVRVSTLKADAQTTVSERRGCDPRKLRDELHGELDWLVMKALEKDRNRRYASASELSDDVCRFLAGEAIHAHPPSRPYQLRKFVRRHFAVVATSVAFFLLLLAGIVGISWQLLRAMEAERQAETAISVARLEATRAMSSLQTARDAVDRFYLLLGTRWIEDDTSPSNFQSAILGDAATFYRELAEMPIQSGAASKDFSLIASGYQRFGQIKQYLSEFAEAAHAYEKSIKTLQQALAESPEDSQLRSELCDLYYERGRSLFELARRDEARQSYELSTKLAQQLVDQGSDARGHRYMLARIKTACAETLLGDRQCLEAAQLATSAKEELHLLAKEANDQSFWRSAQGELFRADVCRARAMAYTGDLETASALCEALSSQLAVRRTTNWEDAKVLHLETAVRELSAEVAALREDLTGAAESYQSVLQSRRQRLPGGFAPDRFLIEAAFKRSTNMDGQIEFDSFCEYVETNLKLSTVLRRLDRPYASEKTLGECHAVMAVLVAERPDSLRYQIIDANLWTLAADLLAETRRSEAIVLLTHANEIWSQTIRRFPQAKEFVSGIHGCQTDWQHFRTVGDHFGALPFANGERAANPRDTVFCHHANALSWARTKSWDSAVSDFERSLAKRTHGKEFDWLQLAIAYAEKGENSKAEAWCEKAHSSIVQMSSPNPEATMLRDEAMAVINARNASKTPSSDPISM